MQNDMFIPLFVALILYFYLIVIIFKRKDLKSVYSFSRDLKTEMKSMLPNNPKKEGDIGQQLKLGAQVKQKIAETKETLAELFGSSSFLGKILLRVKGQLGDRMIEKLEKLEASIAAGGLIEAGIGEKKTMFPIRSSVFDFVILFIMLMPLLFWSAPISEKVFMGYSLRVISVFLISIVWGIIYLWDNRSGSIISKIASVWDEIIIYSLVPFQENQKQERMISLMSRLEDSSRQFDKSVGVLNASIVETPQEISARVEERLTERATITETLKRIKNANDELSSSIKSHSNVIENIPELLSSSVSAEVSKGLNPISDSVIVLKEKLTESYGSMSKALELTTTQLIGIVRNLSDREFLENWIDELAKSASSITSVGQALDKYFENARRSGDAILEVAKCVKDTQKSIGDQLLDLGKLSQLRGIDEAVFRKEIHDLFKNNLNQIEAEHRNFRGMIDDFIHTVAKDNVIRSALHEHIPNTLEQINYTSKSLGDLLEKVESVPEEYARIIQEIKEKSAETEKRLFSIFRKELEGFNENVSQNQNDLIGYFKKIINKLTGLAAKTTENTEKQLKKQREDHQLYVRDMTEYNKKYQDQLAVGLKKFDSILSKTEERSRNWASFVEKSIAQQKDLNSKNVQVTLSEIKNGFSEMIENLSENWEQAHNVIQSSQEQIGQLSEQINKDAERFSELISKADKTYQYLKSANKIAITNTVFMSGFLALAVYMVFFRG